MCLCSPSSINLVGQRVVTLSGFEGNHRPGVKYWQPATGFMTMSPVGCLPRDQDQDPALTIMVTTLMGDLSMDR